MPDWRAEVRARLSGVRLEPAREAEIVEELALHLEDRWRELVGGGASPEAAARAALAEFTGGDVLARRMAGLRQARWRAAGSPGANGSPVLGGLCADLRVAWRTLGATPAFTVVALVVLALGIGATTAIFSVVDAVVLRGLPFEESDRLVAVGERRSGAARAKPGPIGPAGPAPFGAADPEALLFVQPQNYLDWVAGQRAFGSIAAIASTEFTLGTPGGEPEVVAAQRVTSGFFEVLRVWPARGRAFTAESEAVGRDRVAVLSDAFWRRRFGGDPAVVGRTLLLDGSPYEVIGVMPSGFRYPVGALEPTQVWVPYVVPADERVRGRTHSVYLATIARLRDGVSLGQARADVDRVQAAIERQDPEWNRGRTVGVRPLRDHLVGASVRSWMLMLLVAVAIVLLIACANVGSLLLARATTRQREVAVRSALGASRFRLVRQLLVESLLLAGCGTVLAVVFAWWAVGVLKGAMPEGVPRVATIGIDLRVFAAAAGLALATGVLCGMVPALQSSRPDLTRALNHGARGTGAGRGRRRLQDLLVVAELALTVVLVVGSALFISSFARVMRIEPGFDPEGVLTAQVHQPEEPGEAPADLAPALGEIVQRLEQVPGVSAAAVSFPGIPLRPQEQVVGFAVRGRAIDPSAAVSIKLVTPGYHRALGIPLRRGRLLEATDRSGTQKVVLINEAAARQFFGSDDPLGQVVTVSGAERLVVGVVGDARQGALEAVPAPETYLPLSQGGAPHGYLVARTSGDPYRLLPALRSAVLGRLPDVPLRALSSLDELVRSQTAKRRLTMLMLGLLGLLGLVIAAVGVYGLMAYGVLQRTHEIAIRMALGASRATVTRMVYGQAGRLVALGVSIGGAGAWYLSGSVRSFLYGIEASDVQSFVAAAATLSLTALAACIVPARRAATVDPVVALRDE